MEEPSRQEEALGYCQPTPSEPKDELIKWARACARGNAATYKFLDAGRGNPNWVATTPREAFFLLGQFALEESRRVWDEPELGGVPHPAGCADRLRAFLARADGPGAVLLRRALDYGASKLGFQPDAFVHELVDAVVGDSYPVPDRMLVHAEQIVARYLDKEMYDNRPPPGRFDLFAVEGATAGICYAFRSLMTNGILHKGDSIALGTPIFAPYLEIPELRDFGFDTLELRQSEMSGGRHSWQYPDSEIAKLEDPKVKAFFVVNPGNPGSCAMRQQTVDRIVELVQKRRPDLLIISDDVYGTFVEGFRSLAGYLPHNTILVYSFSKFFGCTGWRLGVVALHEDNVIDRMIAAPDQPKFIDRMVADSRDVALNHTAGLSPPQQAQMALFALFALLDENDDYKKRTRAIIGDRFTKLYEGLGLPVVDDPLRAGYYATLDLEAWGVATFGEEYQEYVANHHDPLEIVLALARKHGTVLLNGSAFSGPPWSARVSLANLSADQYAAVGRDLRAIAERAVAAWKTGRTR
jgi:aspartate 4-decarboxylase